MPAGNVDFDTLLATTLDKHLPKLEDNAFTATPLMDWLTRSGNVKTYGGGAEIVVPLEYAQNATAASYSGFDTLDVTPQEEATAAVYPWRQFSVSIVVNGLESEIQNAGDEQKIDLVKTKVNNAEKSVIEALAADAFSDGTGNSGKDFYGLDLLVNDETGTATVAGIDCTDPLNTWWRSDVTDAGSTERDDAEWTTAYYNASNGGIDMPNFAITTQALFEHYEAGLVDQLRFTSNEKADARFMSLEFKGIRIYFDANCTSGSTFFLNSEYLYLFKHPSRWLAPTGWKEAIDKDARYMQLLSAGNLATSNRSRQARVDNQTTS